MSYISVSCLIKKGWTLAGPSESSVIWLCQGSRCSPIASLCGSWRLVGCRSCSSDTLAGAFREGRRQAACSFISVLQSASDATSFIFTNLLVCQGSTLKPWCFIKSPWPTPQSVWRNSEDFAPLHLDNPVPVWGFWELSPFSLFLRNKNSCGPRHHRF